jgi:hypothetical protein
MGFFRNALLAIWRKWSLGSFDRGAANFPDSVNFHRYIA